MNFAENIHKCHISIYAEFLTTMVFLITLTLVSFKCFTMIVNVSKSTFGCLIIRSPNLNRSRRIEIRVSPISNFNSYENKNIILE